MIYVRHQEREQVFWGEGKLETIPRHEQTSRQDGSIKTAVLKVIVEVDTEMESQQSINSLNGAEDRVPVHRYFNLV